MKAIFWRDLKLTLGSGGGFGQGLGFFLVVILLFVLAFRGEMTALRAYAPALIYVATLLAGLLSLERIFRIDVEDGTMLQLRLSPYPFELVIAIKVFVHWLTSGLAVTLITPLISLLLGLHDREILILMLSLLLGTPALSLIGAIGAALTISIERSSLIQALITLPLYLPTLIYGTTANQSGPHQGAAFALLGGLSLFMLVLAPWVCGYILRQQQE